MFFSLRSRLMTAFSILMIVPFALLAFTLSEQAEEIIQASVESSAAQTIDQFASHAVTLMTQIEDIGSQVMSSRTAQAWAALELDRDRSTAEAVLAKQALREYMSSYALNNSNGISITTYTESAGGMWTQDRTYRNSEWYRRYQTENLQWTAAHQDNDQGDLTLRNREVNSFVLPLVHLQSLRAAGIVKVNYPTALLRSAIGKIQFGETGKVFLLTGDGGSVLNQDLSGHTELLREALSKLKGTPAGQLGGVFSIEHEGVDYSIFFRKLPAADWTIVGEVPEEELYAQIKRTRRTILLVTLLLLVVAGSAAYRLSAGVTQPLSAMARAMKHVKLGEFAAALGQMQGQKTSGSEVGYVAGEFERMTQRLQYLIETEYETNLRRKSAEYKALLLQINPHFYNNTLEIITGLAAMKREDLVMDAAEALGKMMRYSLNLNSDLVRAGQELDYIRDYLLIQQLRHGDRLKLAVRDDGPSRQPYIAKFILQPLVENAVKYSLEKEGTAEVEISAGISGERLVLSVRDNGIGMKPELVRELQAEGESGDAVPILDSEGHSIGLRNVLSRCRLQYGQAFRLTLQSAPGKGTEIILNLPILRGEPHV
ncbi:sensor histidine kinase [Paenibacillus sp. S-38]|uniref:sensor histidine kinase n=1 Tax=Paenibacillus sp. S-38 TaxID=3416710 RepID=UPI003CF272E4